MRMQPLFRWQYVPLPLVLIVVFVTLGAAVINPAIIRLQRAQSQQSAQDRYGAAVQLCQSKLPAANPNLALPATLKIAAVGDDQTRFTAYDDQIPAQYHASSATDLTAILCVHSTEIVYATDTYTNNDVCHRLQKNVTVNMLDVKTGGVIRSAQFAGPIPPECPQSIQFALDTVGDWPNAAQVIDWAIRR